MKKRATFLSCLFILFGAFAEGALPNFLIEHQIDLGEQFEFFETGIHLFQEREGKRIVETISFVSTEISQNLNDGYGTLIFSALAEEDDVIFHPFYKDFSKRKKFLKICKSLFPKTKTFSSAQSFFDTMKHFQHSIDLLSLQFIPDESNSSIRPRYQLFQELVTAVPHLSDNAIILLNDKSAGRSASKLFIRYLCGRGWSIIYESPYGLIFSKI
jgi:hypothetical protein